MLKKNEPSKKNYVEGKKEEKNKPKNVNYGLEHKKESLVLKKVESGKNVVIAKDTRSKEKIFTRNDKLSCMNDLYDDKNIDYADSRFDSRLFNTYDSFLRCSVVET
jgi:hypothetical protein